MPSKLAAGLDFWAIAESEYPAGNGTIVCRLGETERACCIAVYHQSKGMLLRCSGMPTVFKEAGVEALLMTRLLGRDCCRIPRHSLH